MLNFENKPIKDWTLAECKEYCENKRNKHNTYCSDIKCVLWTHDICSYEPKYYKISPSIPRFTPDEIAYCRLIKKACPWASYIARTHTNSLFFVELRPRFDDSGYLKAGTTGMYTKTLDDFFPQIKPLTYYLIDDIIKQGEKNVNLCS